jgi:hypothetical protein
MRQPNLRISHIKERIRDNGNSKKLRGKQTLQKSKLRSHKPTKPTAPNDIVNFRCGVNLLPGATAA